MGGAARVAPLALQPSQGMLHQVRGLLPLGGCGRSAGTVGLIQQHHQGRCQLLSGPALGLPLEGMPLAITDGQQVMQGLGCLLAPLRPASAGGSIVDRLTGLGNHWTEAGSRRHPGAMDQRPRSPFTPIRWLHQLSGLMAQVSQAERLPSGDDSLRARRLRQRLALAQRLLDPIPAPLSPGRWHERLLWQFLRWGGVGLALAVWLKR